MNGELEFAWKFTRRHWVAAIFLFSSYLIASQIGRELFTAPAIIFPAAGIALAVLFLEGLRLWPVVLLAALLHYFVGGTALITGIGLAIAHTLQAFIGAYVLKLFGINSLLNRMRDMFIFMVVAIGAATIVPTIGRLSIYLNHLLTGGSLGLSTWGSWWVGTIMSLLIVAPFIIRWFGNLSFTRTFWQWIEIVASFTFLVVVTVPLFWMGIGQIADISLVYIMLIPLFWIALRLGTRFTTLALLALTVIAIGGTFFGHANIRPELLGTRLYQTEIFLDIIAFIFFIVVSLDEERKRATRALETQITKLKDALTQISVRDRAKSDFLAVLAHELRNPLAPVVSSVELLKLSGNRTPDEEEALTIMDGKLKSIQRLLDDLLDVSRIAREKLTIQKDAVNLEAMIRTAATSVEGQLKERSQELSIHVPSEALIIDADAVRIEQVITNLLTNASKFTEEGGAISITVRKDGNEAEIRVKDNGIGIEWNMLSRIFDPFLQLERGERRSMGLGIGLSLTKQLVEMHNGSIRAESQGKGHGSEFVIRFPLTRKTTSHVKETETPLRVPIETAGRSGDRKHVLVVDDNEAAAHGIGKLLALTGYDVSYAYNGREAIERAIEQPPYAIVLDIGLPDMDGYKVAEALRSDADFEGVLTALTGYGQAEDKQKAYEAGFDYHLVKPIGIAELERVLRPVR